MTIRTITQLPEANTGEFLSSWMEMSTPLASNNEKYSSKKASYAKIKNDIQTATATKIVSDYSLNGTDGRKINVAQLESLVSKINSSDSEFSGKKKFNEWPYVQTAFPDASKSTDPAYSVYGNDFEYILPNMKVVREMVDDNVVFMSTTKSCVSEGNPLPLHSNSLTKSGVVEYLDYSNTIGLGKFYYWHIDAQQQDSSWSNHDKDSGSTDKYEEMRDTGNLVAWGWLAENGETPPQPEQCWVGMFAKMKCEGYNDTEVDVPICIKPWIRGKNAATIQYIGFNIPVRKGLRIKIKTGFPVNNENGGLQTPGSLTFQDGGIPNAFFGYIIK